MIVANVDHHHPSFISFMTGYRGIRDSSCCNSDIGLGIRTLWMHSHWRCHHVLFRLGRSSHDDWQIFVVSIPRSDRPVSMDCGSMYGTICRHLYRHSEYYLFVYYMDFIPDISQRLAHDWIERNAVSIGRFDDLLVLANSQDRSQPNLPESRQCG